MEAISGALRRPELPSVQQSAVNSSARGRRSHREVLGASPAGSRRPEISAIADAIAADVAADVWRPAIACRRRETWPRLALDFTTAARGYVEAGKRGLVECVVGRGTFVRRHASVRAIWPGQRSRADFMMNMPPSRTIRRVSADERGAG